VTRAIRSLVVAVGLVVLAIVGAACGPPPTTVDVDGQTTEIAATDPELLDAIESLSFLFYNDADAENGCGALVDLDAVELDDRQPVSHQGINVADRTEHAFGAITGAGRRAFVVLGSVRPLAMAEQADPLPLLPGTIVAVGCRELDVVEGTRFNLPVVLFPAGLR
jgi:hypothetical protein